MIIIPCADSERVMSMELGWFGEGVRKVKEGQQLYSD